MLLLASGDILSLDLDSGSTTLVSENDGPGGTGLRGSLDTATDTLFLHTGSAITTVDLVTGDRTVFSSTESIGDGLALGGGIAIAIDLANGSVYLGQLTYHGLLVLNSFGDRALFSR